MDNQTLHQKYLREGTAGYAVIRRFYSRYTDVLAHSTIVSVDDVVHEVFVSLSKTDFTKVQNVEHYVMRAIKLHCWSLLDRAIRLKALVVENTNDLDSDETVKGATPYVDHPTELRRHQSQLLSAIINRRSQLRTNSIRIIRTRLIHRRRSASRFQRVGV